MSPEEIRLELFRLQDKEYRDFQSKLIPTVDPKSMIGVRTPALRKLAKQLSKETDIAVYLDLLPHKYFDENQVLAGVEKVGTSTEHKFKSFEYSLNDINEV